MEIINLIFDILTILLVLYFIFFKSYFSEKGKNIAKKEDIEEITEKIENLKLSIQNINSKRHDWFLENKQSIIDFYDNYILWTECSTMKIDIITSATFYPDKFRQVIDELNIQHSKILTSIGRIELYEFDEQFIKSIKDFYSIGFELHHLIYIFLLEMESISYNINQMDLFLEKDTGKTLLTKILNDKTKTIKNRGMIIKKFLDDSKNLMTENKDSKNKFIKTIRDKIKEKYPAANSQYM